MRRPGRPSTAPDLAALVARLANENPTWGYTRIRGALQHLGHDVARNTIKAILQNHGIEPAPERGTKTPWKTFLAAHWDGLAAADFFTVEVLTWRGLPAEAESGCRRCRSVHCKPRIDGCGEYLRSTAIAILVMPLPGTGGTVPPMLGLWSIYLPSLGAAAEALKLQDGAAASGARVVTSTSP
jgi:hypothetical protein